MGAGTALRFVHGAEPFVMPPKTLRPVSSVQGVLFRNSDEARGVEWVGWGGLGWNASMKVRTGAYGRRWLVGGRYQ